MFSSANGAFSASSGQLVQKIAQRGCRLELRDGIEPLEGASEGLGETPHCAWRELVELRFKVKSVNLGQQALRDIELTLNEGRVEDQLRPFIADLRLPPLLDLPLHGLEVALHPINANRDAVHQRKRLRVFREDGREHT